jgi:hypothetical protein
MSQPQTRQYQGGGRDAQGFGSRGTDSRLYQAYNERPNRYPGQGDDGSSPGTGGKPSRSKKTLITTLVIAAVLGGALGLGGAYLFGGLFGSDDDATAAAPVHNIAQIASAIGCKPVASQNNSQYKQAACTTSGGNRYTILTFDTDDHMKAWQEEAAGYGGAYLVGTKWLVVANNQNELTPYVDKLGGEVIIDKHG